MKPARVEVFLACLAVLSVAAAADEGTIRVVPQFGRVDPQRLAFRPEEAWSHSYTSEYYGKVDYLYRICERP